MAGNILGLSFMYHDSAAALLQDGEVAAAAAEERFSRQKHSLNFPELAVASCLELGGIRARDLDCVVFYEKPLLKFHRILMMHLRAFPRGLAQFRQAMPLWFKWKLFIPQLIRERLGFAGRVLFADHHYAHAASAFYASGFDRAAVLTMDGVGEWATVSRGVGEGRRLVLQDELRYPHSLGLLYSAVTAFLGFEVNEGEGKVMGLSSYGEPAFFDRLWGEVIKVEEDGSFRLNMDYFLFDKELVMYSPKFVAAFGPPRAPGGPVTRRDEDLAASLQKVLEEAALRLARGLRASSGCSRLCIAGGVGLNSVCNGRLLREAGFDEIFIQPASGDDGGALGAALWAYHGVLGRERKWSMQDAYLGPACGAAEIRSYLRARRIAHEEYPDFDRLAGRAARDLAAGRMVGWFQGRMEYGPRALGNRSILANPALPGMKDALNLRVKHREPFRPFAPAVLEERSADYFDLSAPSPYMLLVGRVRPGKRAEIPAVTHVDGTARVQTVARARNPRFYGLIARFRDLTGVPLLLNTSFNVRGEPIVCDHRDAMDCFLNTGLDALVLGDCYVAKHASP